MLQSDAYLYRLRLCHDTPRAHLTELQHSREKMLHNCVNISAIVRFAKRTSVGSGAQLRRKLSRPSRQAHCVMADRSLPILVFQQRMFGFLSLRYVTDDNRGRKFTAMTVDLHQTAPQTLHPYLEATS